MRCIYAWLLYWFNHIGHQSNQLLHRNHSTLLIILNYWISWWYKKHTKKNTYYFMDQITKIRLHTSTFAWPCEIHFSCIQIEHYRDSNFINFLSNSTKFLIEKKNSNSIDAKLSQMNQIASKIKCVFTLICLCGTSWMIEHREDWCLL